MSDDDLEDGAVEDGDRTSDEDGAVEEEKALSATEGLMEGGAGRSNGHRNGHRNGRPNGRPNGHPNGHPNGPTGWSHRIYTLDHLRRFTPYRWLVLATLFAVVTTASVVTWLSFRFSDASPTFFPPDHHIQRAVDLQRYAFTTPFWMAGE